MLTPEQQQQVVDLLPMARKLAKGDDELFGVAQLALCKSVERYNADKGVSLRTWCWRYMRQALYHARRAAAKQVTNFKFSDIADVERIDVFESLDAAHREVAELFWVRKMRLRGIARMVKLPWRQVRSMLLTARRHITGEEHDSLD